MRKIVLHDKGELSEIIQKMKNMGYVYLANSDYYSYYKGKQSSYFLTVTLNDDEDDTFCLGRNINMMAISIPEFIILEREKKIKRIMNKI